VSAAPRAYVRCTDGDCGWVGVRAVPDCECYDYACHPAAGGAGCPRGSMLDRPCPRSGHPVRFADYVRGRSAP
jgi:hypothetical protein